MRLLHRPAWIGAAMAGGISLALLVVVFAWAGQAVHSPNTPAVPGLSEVPLSAPAVTDQMTGAYRSPAMSVEIALAPRNQTGLRTELIDVAKPGGPLDHHFLWPGAFENMFAPSTHEWDTMASYLRSAGLTVQPAGSPFLVRASGSSARVSAAFHTFLGTYRNKNGIWYFSNSSPVELPSALVNDVQGVIGLTGTVRGQPSGLFSKIQGESRPVAAGR